MPSATRNYLLRRYLLGPVLRLTTGCAALLGIALPPLREAIKAPIFIVGCSRSGTTLFAEVFGARADACNIMDASQVWDLDYYDKSGDDHRDENDAGFWETARIRTSFAIRCAMSGGGRLINKNNQNSLRLRFIKSLFPDAYIVHVVRDARPVVLSNVSRIDKDTYRRSFPFGRFPKPVAWRSYLDKPLLEQFAHQWRDITEQVRTDGLKQFGPDRYTEVKFEEFCADPRKIIAGVDAFCDLPSCNRPEDVLAAISRDQSDSWVTNIPGSDRGLIEKIAGPQLAAFGYTPGNPS